MVSASSSVGLWAVLCLSTSSAATPVQAIQIQAWAKPSRSAPNTSESTYRSQSYAGMQALQGYYNKTGGLWGDNLWWNSANCLQVLTDWAVVDKTDAEALAVPSIISNTFSRAQGRSAVARKTLSNTDLVTSTYTWPNLAARDGPPFSGFINNFYDDEGWWALAWIRSWDVVGTVNYLNMAEKIFADMQKGEDKSVCGGGIWWSKNNTYKNAIANELYLAVAASLANRVQEGSVDYKEKAIAQWTWFKNSGMINAQSNINDGLTILANGTCVNNNGTAWSYNQGVVLGGLVELARATNDSSYLDEAARLALAGIALLSDAAGVIHDVCEPAGCGSDGAQFKGIFMRNLKYLYDAAPAHLAAVRTSILLNANSVWEHDQDDMTQFGVDWSGPPQVAGGPNATTTSSALDSLVAALAVV